MELNDEQKKAVEYLEGPLLVVAGPGTGKTQLLSQKVAYILEKTDAGAENILCLTFTDSGAQNMRERLKSIIGKDAMKITIGTYHTFGSEILSMYKTYSENYDRRLDEAIDEVRQFKIIKEIQEKLPGTDILRGDAVKDIISVISDAKGAGFGAEDLALVAKQNMEDSEVLSQAISPLLLNVVPRKFEESYNNAYAPIYEILSKYTDTGCIVNRVERVINIIARELATAIEDAVESQKITPLSKWKDTFFEKDAKGNYRLKDRVANKKLASVAKVMAEYERYLRENGLYDFDDMIEEAVKALKEDAGFRATLMERYQFILLDEFQDTNPSQLSIVKELTDYEKPVVMAVGDDDQAIYVFQGALSSNLQDFRDYYHAEVVTLTENYRSTQEILDFSREVIKQAEGRQDKKLHANKPVAAESRIYRYEFAGSDAEFGFVADKIAELVEAGVSQKEIAVISAKHKYFEPFLPYLKAKQGIKIAYEKRDNLLEDERIHEILTVARYVWELANEKRPSVQLMEILSYPYFGVPIIEVIRLMGQARAEHRQAFEYLSENGSEQVQEVMKYLAGLVTRSFTEPLERLLDYIMGLAPVDGYRSGFLEYHTKPHGRAADDEQALEYSAFTLYESIASLKGKLSKHFGERKLKLGDLVEMIDDYEAADMPIGVTSPYKDSAEAVQIMTAHKAKGLEFDYVFILSADHTAWGKGKGNNNLLVLPKNMMQIRHTGTTDGEKLRVLYVALTRAREGLYITNSLMDFNGKSPERLEYFEESIQENKTGEKEVVSPFLPIGKVVQMTEVGSVAKREENLRNWLASYIVESPDMREIYRERVAGMRMTASVLTSFIDIIYGGPQEFFRSRILMAPREPDTGAQVRGNIMHAVFDEVSRNNLSDEEAAQLYLKQLDEYDTTVEIKDEIRELGLESVAKTLEAFGTLIRSGKSEVNFGPEKLAYEGVPLAGKIDLITVDEKTKTIDVYDYKTATYRKEGWKSHPTLYSYMLQLMFYKLLLNLSPQYRKYQVVRGHILFVTPDKDGEVHDKVYEFDQEDEQEFLKLLTVVYRLIVSLGFMDDAELMIASDKGRAMKDVKEFIALLLAKIPQ